MTESRDEQQIERRIEAEALTVRDAAPLMRFSDAGILSSILTELQYSVAEELGIIVDVIRDGDPKQQLSAVKMLHERRQEALREAGLSRGGGPCFNPGRPTFLMPRENKSIEEEPHDPTETSTVEDKPGTSGTIDAVAGSRPENPERAGLQGLAYHPTAKR